MTNIYCSNKLKEFISKTPLSLIDKDFENVLGDWNAHLFYMKRLKNLIFINNKTFYCVIVENVKKTDLQNIENLFISRMADQFQFDKIISQLETLPIIQKYLPLTLSQTNNDKKVIGTMNQYVYDYEIYRSHQRWYDADIKIINSLINDTLTRAGGNETRKYGQPIEDMKLLVNKYT